MNRYSLFLPDHLRQGLKALKERDGVPESEAIRRATAEFLKARGIALDERKGGMRPTKKR